MLPPPRSHGPMTPPRRRRQPPSSGSRWLVPPTLPPSSCGRTPPDLFPAEIFEQSTRPETELESVVSYRRVTKLEWAAFDRRVIHGFAAPYSSTTAAAKTSNNKEVRLSVRFARPPLSSYVELYTDDYLHGEPLVVAAHEDLLLLYIVVGFNGAHACHCPGNFLVYKADPGWPWLKRLPTMGEHAKHWLGRGQDTGVYRKGEEFFVACLQSLVGIEGQEVAEMFRYSSATNSWRIFRLKCQRDPENGFCPKSWSTDSVFSFGNFMCWADYHQGVVYSDISAAEPELQFVRFPGIESWFDLEHGRGLPEMNRSVSMCKTKLWFINIDDGRFQSEENSAKGEKGRNCCQLNQCVYAHTRSEVGATLQH